MIRAKTAADVQGLVSLMFQTHEQDAYPRFLPSDPARFMNPPEEVAGWVAEEDDAIVGHVALHTADDSALQAAFSVAGLVPAEVTLVARLMVNPSRRGTGLGTRLLATAVDQIRQSGLRPALDVDVDAAGAIALYEKLGWQRIGGVTLTVHDGNSLDLWVYLAPASRIEFTP